MGRFQDLAGLRFGRLVVKELVGVDKWGSKKWRSLCDCGKEKICSAGKLKSGDIRSCGCLQQESRLVVEDFTGKRFSRLLVLSRVESDKFGHTRWLCKCDCGNEVIVIGDNLKRDHTTSCGCYKIDTAGTFNATHRQTNTRLYRIWAAMKERANGRNTKSSSYKFYAGKGVTICEEWNESFESFMEWSLNNGYSEEIEDLEIDRINNDGNYESSNCRWVPRHINVANRGILKSNTSGYVGVNYDTHNNVWVARISSKSLLPNRITIGYFSNKEDAVRARNEFIKVNNLPHPIQEIR